MEEFFVEALIFFIIAAILVRVIKFSIGKWRVASFIFIYSQQPFFGCLFKSHSEQFSKSTLS